ncbi:Multi antimicrobial extrusion protein [Trema orientale]|uniref:Multi antimicrobial extrusion protein n=1 Tax=Trema orientale TaxID=63057 RepID=A0A2P5E9X9_TREOI|nr:Multi antimicrobial extrusion protein [Trema orientale]
MESEKEDLPFITSISIEKQRSIETSFTRNEIVDEVKKQLWLAGPLMAVSVLTKLMQVISLMFVGHLGELSLSAASMATSFVSVTCLCLLIGLATALDTLCGQSYGAKQYHMMGIQTQRAMFVLLLLSIPLSIVAANTRSILVAVGQDPEIATEAGHFALYSIPSIFAYAPLLCLNRFLKSQSLVFPMMGSIGFTTLLHIFVCWILVFESGLGIKGAALANSISYWINVLILGLYVKYSSSCEETWTGFSKEAFYNIGNFLGLGIPSALMVW